MSKIYHIYVKDKCIIHSISEEEFELTWKALNYMIGIIESNYTPKDLSYEELVINKEVCLNSSY